MVQLTQGGGKRPLFPVTAKAVVPVGVQVLLLRRLSGKWDLPGGKLRAGEETEACLVRECAEEIGFAPQISRLLAARIRRRGNIKPDPFVCFYLCRSLASGQVVSLSAEHDSYQLFGAGELADLKMPKIYREVLADYFANP
jgi:8-oxo-dGTP pyrophosphatase MutT (NUDIX family)